MRPTKLTPAVQDRVVHALRTGNFREVAARHAGIDPATFHRWMDRGRRAQTLLSDLEEQSCKDLCQAVRVRHLKDYPVFSDEDPFEQISRKPLPKRPKKTQLVAALLGEEARYVNFRNAVTRATAEAEVEAVELLRKHGEDGDTRALMFYLERAHADRWGRRDRLALEQIPDEALQAEARRLQQEIAAARAASGQ